LEFQAPTGLGPFLSLTFAKMLLGKHGEEWQEATARYPAGESWVGFDAVPLVFATVSFTFTMFEGISCTFLAEQVFMLPLVITRRVIPSRNIEIPLP
jgi:hypothetical protein